MILRQAQFQPDINLHWDELGAEDKQTPLSTPTSRSSSDDEDDLVHITISEHLSKLKIDGDDVKFHGSSSNIMLVKHAMDVKTQYAGAPNPGARFKRPQYWGHHAVSLHHTGSHSFCADLHVPSGRKPLDLGTFPQVTDFLIPIS